jgi:hypothetical protein
LPQDTVIKVIVGDRTGGNWSYGWRFWASRTSFYVKPLVSALGEFKLSFHGPDPDHGKPGYKFAWDEQAAPKAARAGGAARKAIGWTDKYWFAGKEVVPGVDLVLRLRFTHDLFGTGIPNSHRPSDLQPGEVGLLVPPPSSPGETIDLDVFVCHDQPYWPSEEQARQDNACVGPLENAAGQYLTAVAIKRSVATTPSPVMDYAAPIADPYAIDPADQLRGFGAAYDEAEFMWVQELWLSRTGLTSDTTLR